MAYILFEENKIPLTKSQKEKGREQTYSVDRIKSVFWKYEADEWVNKDSEYRSWSEQ